MARTRVAVLGASGMLGAMVVDQLAADGELDVVATVRERAARDKLAALYPSVEWRLLDADGAEVAAVAAASDGASFIINCIGIIKSYIHDDRADEVERAIRVNALFPHLVARAAARSGARVVQIATDCVYSGSVGHYDEKAAHDALDVYGKTKSLGEVPHAAVQHLRCSIIGPESKAYVSLLEWFLKQPRGAEVKGFTNHHWNGVTTLHYARLCRGIIRERPALGGVQHVVPTGTLSKAEMLGSFAAAYGRQDLRIVPTATAVAVDRTLSTHNAALNAELWRAAGYATPPTVPQMIEELARGSYRFQEARS